MGEKSIYPSEYDIPTQVVTTEAIATTRQESITMQQSFPLAHVGTTPKMEIPVDVYGSSQRLYNKDYVNFVQQPHVLTYSPSLNDAPQEILTSGGYTGRTSIPTVQEIQQSVPVAPVLITEIHQDSIESQKVQSHMYSSSISTSGQPPENLQSRVTKVVTTEVQRTTVSVVHERLPQVIPPSVEITIQPDIAKVQSLQKQNGKVIYPGDVIDLRTVKLGVKMTDSGMDLTPTHSRRQSFSSDSSGRQITAVQPEIVNLSPVITPATTLSVVTDSITIVTCTATIASYSTPAERPLDLQGSITSMPLPLATGKTFEPLAQIVYRPLDPLPVAPVSTMASIQDAPMNLSFGAITPLVERHTSVCVSNGYPVISLEATGAMDLSNYKPMRAIVAYSSTSPGVVTTVVEDDASPVDLTAARRSVCCDVIYKLPFTRSCRTQPPVTAQPDNRLGYKDYHYNTVATFGVKGVDIIKASASETNLAESGLFTYEPKNGFAYLSRSSEGAVDLTPSQLSAGEYKIVDDYNFECGDMLIIIANNSIKLHSYCVQEAQNSNKLQLVKN